MTKKRKEILPKGRTTVMICQGVKSTNLNIKANFSVNDLIQKGNTAHPMQSPYSATQPRQGGCVAYMGC